MNALAKIVARLLLVGAFALATLAGAVADTRAGLECLGAGGAGEAAARHAGLPVAALAVAPLPIVPSMGEMSGHGGHHGHAQAARGASSPSQPVHGPTHPHRAAGKACCVAGGCTMACHVPRLPEWTFALSDPGRDGAPLWREWPAPSTVNPEVAVPPPRAGA